MKRFKYLFISIIIVLMFTCTNISVKAAESVDTLLEKLLAERSCEENDCFTYDCYDEYIFIECKSDITLTNTLLIKCEDNVDINLNGYTLKMDWDHASDNCHTAIMCQDYNGILCIQNGTFISDSKNPRGIGISTSQDAQLILSNVTVANWEHATYLNGAFTFFGAKFTHNKQCINANIYHECDCAIYNSSFVDNESKDANLISFSSAIKVVDHRDLYIENTIFSGNKAYADLLFLVSNNSMILQDIQFTNNIVGKSPYNICPSLINAASKEVTIGESEGCTVSGNNTAGPLLSIMSEKLDISIFYLYKNTFGDSILYCAPYESMGSANLHANIYGNVGKKGNTDRIDLICARFVDATIDDCKITGNTYESATDVFKPLQSYCSVCCDYIISGLNNVEEDGSNNFIFVNDCSYLLVEDALSLLGTLIINESSSLFDAEESFNVEYQFSGLFYSLLDLLDLYDMLPLYLDYTTIVKAKNIDHPTHIINGLKQYNLSTAIIKDEYINYYVRSHSFGIDVNANDEPYVDNIISNATYKWIEGRNMASIVPLGLDNTILCFRDLNELNKEYIINTLGIEFDEDLKFESSYSLENDTWEPSILGTTPFDYAFVLGYEFVYPGFFHVTINGLGEGDSFFFVLDGIEYEIKYDGDYDIQSFEGQLFIWRKGSSGTLSEFVDSPVNRQSFELDIDSNILPFSMIHPGSEYCCYVSYIDSIGDKYTIPSSAIGYIGNDMVFKSGLDSEDNSKICYGDKLEDYFIGAVFNDFALDSYIQWYDYETEEWINHCPGYNNDSINAYVSGKNIYLNKVADVKPGNYKIRVSNNHALPDFFDNYIDVEFVIEPMVLENPVFEEVPTFVYDGQPHFPVIDLDCDLDLTINYPYQTSAGEYNLPVTCDDPYVDCSNVLVHFIIAKAEIDVTVNIPNIIYGNMAPIPYVTGNIFDSTVTYYYKKASQNDSAYQLYNYEDLTLDAGNYTLKAVISENDNYNEKVCVVSFRVEKGLASPEIYAPDFTYGDEVTGFIVSGNLGNGTVTLLFKKASDPASAYTQTVPSLPGLYDIRCVIGATTNYSSYYITDSFEIKKANLSVDIELDDWTYGEIESSINLISDIELPRYQVMFKSFNADGTISDEEFTEMPTDAGKYLLKIRFPESELYNEASFTKIFRINKASISPQVSKENFTYNEVNTELVITGNAANVEPLVVYTKKGTNEEVQINDFIPGKYIVKVTIPSTNNYSGGVCYCEFEVYKATLTLSLSIDDIIVGEILGAPVLDGNTPGLNVSYVYTKLGSSLAINGKPVECGEYSVKAIVEGNELYNGAELTATFKIDHLFSDEWTVDLAPTIDNVGYKSHHCVCGEKKDITEIEKLPVSSSKKEVAIVSTTGAQVGAVVLDRGFGDDVIVSLDRIDNIQKAILNEDIIDYKNNPLVGLDVDEFVAAVYKLDLNCAIPEGSTVEIRLLVPENVDLDSLRLLHVHSEDDISEITLGSEAGVGTYIIEDGYIVTVIDRLSEFAFINVKEEIDIMDILKVMAICTLLLILNIVFMVFYFVKKKYGASLLCTFVVFGIESSLLLLELNELCISIYFVSCLLFALMFMSNIVGGIKKSVNKKKRA